MGSILYDFLNESVLFSESHAAEKFSSISDKELSAEIQRYREYSLTHLGDLFIDIPESERKLRLYGGQEFRNTDRLMQAALYLDCVIVPDPLFELSHRPGHASTVVASYIGMPQPTTVDRNALGNAIRLMRDVTPMVASNYLKFLPASYYSEPPSELLMRYSPTRFADSMPPELLKRYREAVEVRSMVKRDGGWVVLDGLDVGRGIAIKFARDAPHRYYLYNYFEQRIDEIDENTGRFTARLSLPDTPPPESEFHAWMDQSINSAAGDHLRRLETEVSVATACNAAYLTTSPLSSELLAEAVDTRPSIPGDTTSQLMKLELPLLADISMDDLMRIRESDGEAFDLFRRELERQLREVRLENDPERRNVKIQNAVHELTEVKLTDVDQAIKRVRKRSYAEVTVAAAGLVASFATSGVSLFATMIAASQGYKTFRDYQEKVRTNPAYFLWQVIRK